MEGVFGRVLEIALYHSYVLACQDVCQVQFHTGFLVDPETRGQVFAPTEGSPIDPDDLHVLRINIHARGCNLSPVVLGKQFREEAIARRRDPTGLVMRKPGRL